jgi:hypothetical protein
MTDKERYDAYASEVNRRFEEWVNWAIEHWPRAEQPLMESDFAAARRELSALLGPRLGDPGESGRPADRVPDPPGLAKDKDRQFRDMNPMPWP